MNLDKVTRLWRILRVAGDWSCEGQQIAGNELKKLVERLRKMKVEEATDVPRAFILAEGASGAIRVVDTGDAYLYWQ